MTNKRGRANNDEITAARKKKRRKYLLRQTLALFAIIAVLAAVLIAVNSATPTTFSDVANYARAAFAVVDRYPAELSGQRVEYVKTLGIGYAVLSKDKAAIFASNGQEMFDYLHSYASACLKTGNMRALLFGRASKELVVMNHSGVIQKLATDFSIIDADIAQNGAVAALTKSDRYTAQLTVYEKGGYEKLLTWYAAKGFPLAVTLSSDAGTAAVASLVSENSAAKTKITLIDIKSAKETAELDAQGVAIRLIIRNKRLTVITDVGVSSFDMKGNKTSEYAFGTLPMLELSCDEGSFLAVAFGDNDRSAVNEIVVLGSELGEAAVITGVGTVRDIYLARDRLYVLGDDSVRVYSAVGELLEEKTIDLDATAIFVKRGLTAIYPNRIEKIA